MRRGLALLLGLALPLLAQAQQLTVSAASSLTEAFQAIGARFEAAHPGVQLRFNFGASGALLQQIVHGAPVDIFAAADAETLDRGAALWLAGTRRDFAANALLLVTPLEGRARRLDDLGGAAVRRIAIGKPASVPAGRYAQQALVAAGLWQPLQTRLVFADNVRQVLDYVVRGEVEAGLVYRSDAALQAGRLRVAGVVAGHAPIRYPVAVLASSAQVQLARAFVDFLASAPAQALLRERGFAPP